MRESMLVHLRRAQLGTPPARQRSEPAHPEAHRLQGLLDLVYLSAIPWKGGAQADLVRAGFGVPCKTSDCSVDTYH